jgi:hypothetical protein
MKERHQEVKIEKERRVVIRTEKETLKSLAEAGKEMERKARRGVETKTEIIVSVITEVVTGIIAGSVVKEENVVVGMMMITVEAVIVTMIGRLFLN